MSDVCRQHIERTVDWDSGAVGDPYHALKVRNHGGGVDDSRISHRLVDGITGLRDIRRSGNHGVRVGDQLCPERDPGYLIAGTLRNRLEIHMAALTAHTEQVCVRGRSVEALVERGHASGEQLDLAAIQAVAGLQVADILHVEGAQKTEQIAHRIGHQ